MGSPTIKFEIDPPSQSSQFSIEPPDATAPSTPNNPGFFKSMISDIAGILHPSGFNPYPGMGQEEKSAAATDAYQQDQERKKAGYSLPYRALVPVAESVGVNVSGMEESARQGDEAGVLGHAAAVPAVMAVGEGLSKVGELRKSVGEKMQPFARKVTGVEPAVKDAVTKAADKQTEALDAAKVKRGEIMRDNLTTQREALSDIDREKIAVSEKNREIESGNKAQQEAVAKRGVLAKTVDLQSNQLRERLGKVEESVGKEANEKFDAVREKIGNPETDASGLVDMVHGVETNVLQGIPENVKEFRAILAHEGLPDNIADAYRAHTGEEPEGAGPLTWDKLQSIKSRLDTRLRSRTPMNGDLKRALYQVRDGVVEEMGTMAEAHGASEQWGEAKDFWRQYKQDFHEPSGPSGSGSPVAQSLDAVDPKNIRDPFLRKQATTGNRGVDILRKYEKHGGHDAAALAEDLIKNHETMRGLPEKATSSTLKSAPEVHELPARKPQAPLPETPTVNINKVAQEAIARKARNWGDFNARDIGILSSGYIGGLVEHLFKGGGFEFPAAVTAYEAGKFAASRALNKPSVIQWLSKTPQAELDVLAKIPGVDKVKIVNAITDEAVKAKAPVLSPGVRRLLGPANVARIMAVSSKPVANRKEALDSLRTVTQ